MIRQRSRTRSRKGSYSSKGRDPQGNLLWDFTAPLDRTYCSSEIQDYTKLSRLEKPVSHFRTEFLSDPTVTLPPATNSGVGGNSSATVRFDPLTLVYGIEPPTRGGLELAFTGASGISWDQLLNEVMADASGEVTESLFSLVNVAEASQLKTLVPSITNGCGRLLKRGLGRKSLKELANLNLAVQFGVIPLTSDIKGFLGIRGSVRKRLAELESRNGRRVTIRKRQSVVIADVSSDRLVGTVNPDHEWHAARTVSRSYSGALSCQVTGFYVEDTSALIKAYSAAFGLSSPLSTIWELIPFSFVADWFLPIGKSLSAFEREHGFRTPLRSCEIGDFMWSEKRTLEIWDRMKVKSVNYPLWNNLPEPLIGSRSQHYHREWGYPPLDGTLTAPSGWSMNRTALSLSLIAQRAL